MTTLDQLSTALINADKAGDVEAAKALAAEIRKLRSAPSESYDPTEGMSATDKFLAGAGKAFYDTGRGIGQALGVVSRQDVEEARKRDAALMNTTAGKVGNFAGNVATVLPTVFIPGAATLRGAAAIGAVQGALQPSVSTNETLANIGLGAGAGAGGVAAGRALAGGYQGAKALAEPFTQGGRERIAGRVIQRFADDPAKVAAAQGKQSVTGAVPTIAEETADAGIARLQDAVRSLDPQIAGRIDARLAENNASRVAALESMAGDEARRAAAEATRKNATKPLYDKAIAQTVEVTPELEALLKRPSVQKALSRAAGIAAEEGRAFGLKPATAGTQGIQLLDAKGNPLATIGGSAGQPAKINGQTLQDLKMGLDALLKDPTSGIAGKEAVNVKATRDAIVKWMDDSIGEFKAARTGYAAESKPLNQMDVAEYVLNKGTANTSDLNGTARLMPNKLLGLLQDEGALLERATGRKGLGNKLSDVLAPDQENMLRAIASEVDRGAAVARAGNGPGSATAQRMAAQNVLRQMVGPTGLPTSWAESALANTVVGKPLNLLYGGVAEPKIQQILADAVLDPALAGRVAQSAGVGNTQVQNNALRQLLIHAARVTPSSLAVTGKR